MKLNIEKNFLRIKLNPLEMLLSHRGALSIPLDHIIRASTEKQKQDWRQIRAPGTHVPFLLKAGTYHGRRGKEFWQATVGKPHLVIELKDWDYNWIILTIGNNKVWADRINQVIRSMT